MDGPTAQAEARGKAEREQQQQRRAMADMQEEADRAETDAAMWSLGTSLGQALAPLLSGAR